MDKTIILTVIITTLVIGVLFIGYNFFTNKNIETTETTETIFEPVNVDAEATYEYNGPSAEAQARSTKMNSINLQVAQTYPNQDDTTKKIIALCIAGNPGACTLSSERGILL